MLYFFISIVIGDQQKNWRIVDRSKNNTWQVGYFQNTHGESEFFHRGINLFRAATLLYQKATLNIMAHGVNLQVQLEDACSYLAEL